MKSAPQRPDHGQTRALFALPFLLLALLAPAARAQFDRPPELMTYQGFVVDANGDALGKDAPKNYDLIFRIYDQQTGGNGLWTEQQTVTIDKGYLSALLGEGSAITGEPHPDHLSDLFAGPSVVERYVEITVKGVGPGGANVVIAPRLRLLTSPYSFLARTANYATAAGTLVNTSNTPVLSITGTNIGINKPFGAAALDVNGTVAATSFLGATATFTGPTTFGGAMNLTAPSGYPEIDLSGSASVMRLLAYNDGAYVQAGTPSSPAGDLFFGTVGGSRWLTIKGGGNVGIGTLIPAARLDVRGSVQVQDLVRLDAKDGPIITKDWSPFNTNATLGPKSGLGRWGLFMEPGKLYMSMPGSDYPGGSIGFGGWRADGTREDWMTILNGGTVGIGTTSPGKGKLQVEGGLADIITAFGFLNKVTTGATTANSASVNYSIWASDRMAATEFNAYSDARIKQVQGRSDSAADLETLSGIEVTDYTLIDTATKGKGTYKKVIGQQVEQVYPQAVTQVTDVVPDIYVKTEARGGWIPLASQPKPALQPGDRVRLITENGSSIHKIEEVSAEGFRVKERLTCPVFVYGREVKDFRVVDYEAIAMLNVSATQELNRQLKAKDEEIQRLREQVDRLEAQSRQQAARFAMLESWVSKLRPVQTVSAH